MVPGSTLRYGSNFCIATLRPRFSSSVPSAAAVNPLPSELTTPPVTNMYFISNDSQATNKNQIASLNLKPTTGLSIPACGQNGLDALHVHRQVHADAVVRHAHHRNG